MLLSVEQGYCTRNQTVDCVLFGHRCSQMLASARVQVLSSIILQVQCMYVCCMILKIELFLIYYEHDSELYILADGSKKTTLSYKCQNLQTSAKDLETAKGL